MPKLWFYSIGRQKVLGPCSSAELRKMAASGQLSPGDRVRGGRMMRPVQAGMIKGLFPALPPDVA